MLGIGLKLDQRSLAKTLKKLASVDASVGRKALRRGVQKAGSETLKEVKAAAPKGVTGALRRSLARKDIRRADKGYYSSIVGQNRKRVNTSKQIASAARRSGRVSRGLSGLGKEPALHWFEGGTRAHAIRGRLLAWNRGRGGAKLARLQAATVVRHPGLRGTKFVSKIESAGRSRRIKTIQREIETELRKLGS